MRSLDTPLAGHEVTHGQADRTPEPIGPVTVKIEVADQAQLHHQSSAKLLKRGYNPIEQLLQKQLVLPAGVEPAFAT